MNLIKKRIEKVKEKQDDIIDCELVDLYIELYFPIYRHTNPHRRVCVSLQVISKLTTKYAISLDAVPLSHFPSVPHCIRIALPPEKKVDDVLWPQRESYVCVCTRRGSLLISKLNGIHVRVRESSRHIPYRLHNRIHLPLNGLVVIRIFNFLFNLFANINPNPNDSEAKRIGLARLSHRCIVVYYFGSTVDVRECIKNNFISLTFGLESRYLICDTRHTQSPV